MVTQHYSKILACGQAAFDSLVADSERLASFVVAHNHASDLDSLEVLVHGRPEEQMFQLARVEYQHSLYSAAFGQYRQAHVSLRLFF